MFNPFRSPIQYSRYRKLGLRSAWRFSAMTSWCRSVGKGLLALLLAYAIVAYIDDADAEILAHTSTLSQKNNAEAVLISCLQNKAAVVNGLLHLCEFVKIEG